MNLNKFLLTVILTLILCGNLYAQEPETGDQQQWSKWWYGFYLGANYNMFSGKVLDLQNGLPLVALPDGFIKGSGFGPLAGGILEYNSGGLLGGNLQLGYSGKSITFNDFETTSVTSDSVFQQRLTTSHSFITIEPNLRLNLGNRFLHLTAGPSFMINMGKGFDYQQIKLGNKPPVSTKADLPNSRGLVIGGQASIGYDFMISKPSSISQILITPYLQFQTGQSLTNQIQGSDEMFGINSLRLGFQVKFGSRPAEGKGEEPTVFNTDFNVKAPNVITDSRILKETFPIRNYVFFDPTSTDIPTRYKLLPKTDAINFKESDLIKSGVSSGGSDAVQIRSRQQMEIYYNLLNVFGDRLRTNTSANVTLTGYAAGNMKNAQIMADNVKKYLVNNFDIAEYRITSRNIGAPLNYSNANTEDAELIKAESYRVEITTNPIDILKPAMLNSVQEEMLDNDVIVTIPENEDVAFWSIDVNEEGKPPSTQGPYKGTNTARINAKELLGNRDEAKYILKINITRRDGSVVSSQEPQSIRLTKGDVNEKDTQGLRYSILFEFDESKTVQTYTDFLAQSVVPNISNGSTVIIHGHTDNIGNPDYNAKLSQKRVEETQKILTKELSKSGKTVKYDTFGFGEDDNRTPFANSSPEGRFYNRTVVIEIIPGN